MKFKVVKFHKDMLLVTCGAILITTFSLALQVSMKTNYSRNIPPSAESKATVCDDNKHNSNCKVH